MQLWSWEALPSGRSQPYQLLLFDFPKEQPQFDWLTYYHESATPQVELVATCKAPSSNKIKKEKTPWKHRTQEEMEHAFDVDRMVGTEEPQNLTQRRQRRRYLGDSAFRKFTANLLQAR